MMYQGQQNTSSRFFLAVGFVLILHAALIIALKNGFVQQIVPISEKSTVVIDVLEPKPEPPPPPPRPVERREAVALTIPIPEDLPPIPDPIVVPPTDTPTTLTMVTAPPQDAGEGPMITEFSLDGRYPLTRPEYPPPAIRMQQEGIVILMIYVLPNGKVGEARLDRSSGYPLLDKSAMREALRSWRFKPRTVNGEAVAAWGTYKVRFKLDN